MAWTRHWGPWGHTRHQRGPWDWRAQGPDPRQTGYSTKPAKIGILAAGRRTGPMRMGLQPRRTQRRCLTKPRKCNGSHDGVSMGADGQGIPLPYQKSSKTRLPPREDGRRARAGGAQRAQANAKAHTGVGVWMGLGKPAYLQAPGRHVNNLVTEDEWIPAHRCRVRRREGREGIPPYGRRAGGPCHVGRGGWQEVERARRGRLHAVTAWLSAAASEKGVLHSTPSRPSEPIRD